MKFKYIMTKDNGPIIFTNLLNHSEVAQRFSGVTSAGFVTFNDNSCCSGSGVFIMCHEESISLNMKPADGDAERIERLLDL